MWSLKKVHELKRQLAVISGRLTSLLQPLSVFVNKPLRQNMCEHWYKWITEP